MMNKKGNYNWFTFLLILGSLNYTSAQEDPPAESVFTEPVTKFWLNSYGNIRISKDFFWVAQTHLRFTETESTPFAGQIAQIYNRHALGYIYSKRINFALGGVLRLDFDTKDVSVSQNLIPEYRIWHQYQFAMDIGRSVAYHRFRIEHRWTKSFQENSDFIFRNRWRYMFRLKIPINKPKIQTSVLYVAPEAELIMQSGRQVVNSPFEDLRLHTSVGYIFSPQLTAAVGFMYNQGQSLNDGSIYNQGFTLRAHIYFSPDFRSAKNKIPEVHFRD